MSDKTRMGGEEKKELIYKSTVMREYGLTPTMVRELGPPDDYCENPYYSNAGMASLYKVERVEKWVSENAERVQEAKAHRAKCSAAAAIRREVRLAEEREKEAREAENRRRVRAEDGRRAIEWAKTIEISLHGPLPDTLIDDARRQFAFPTGGNVLQAKALLAHVRHNYSNYDVIRRGLKREECSQAMYDELRKCADKVARAALGEWAAANPERVKAYQPEQCRQAADRRNPLSRESAPNGPSRV